MRYIAWGPVRGTTGCLHTTVESARAAVARDKERAARDGGYSDRKVYAIDTKAKQGWWTVADAYRRDPSSLVSL